MPKKVFSFKIGLLGKAICLSYVNFYPESLTSIFEYGRSPDFSTFLCLPAYRSDYEVRKVLIERGTNRSGHEFTVAGTVPDFHWIPF